MIRLMESFSAVPGVLAQANSGSTFSTLAGHLWAVVLFSVVGIVVLGGCFWIMQRLMPFSVRKEIENDQNTALAVIIGAVIIGMSMIIAAAIVG